MIKQFQCSSCDYSFVKVIRTEEMDVISKSTAHSIIQQHWVYSGNDFTRRCKVCAHCFCSLKGTPWFMLLDKTAG